MKIVTKHKIIYPFLVMGTVYIFIEVLFKALMGSMVGVLGIKYLSFVGYTSLWMFIVGAFAGILIGQLNNKPKFYNSKIISQCFIGTVIVLTLEFASGMILNVWLHCNLWSYSNLPFNIRGQICLPFAIAWFLLTPLAIWMDDFLYWIFYNDGKLYSLWSLYKKLILFK